MNYDAKDYVDKFVQIYPNDTHSKWGYIRRVDDLGFLYEITKANEKSDLGIFFVSHSTLFRFKLMEESETKINARYSKKGYPNY